MAVVLVTGGAGYIGSHVAKELSRAGHHAVTVDDLSKGHRDLARWGPLAQADVGDRSKMEPLLQALRPEAIVHLAAKSVVADSMSLPLQTYQANLSSTLVLLEAARLAGVRTFVFSSTAAVYGEPRSVPLGEDHPLAPLSPYGRSKRMVEEVLEDCRRSWGLSYVSLRYFNAAGADPEGLTGEDHTPETHLIPCLLNAALGRSGPLTIYGTDYGTPDGTCVRDFIHVQDLAVAHVRAIDLVHGTGRGLVMNLGTGTGYSVQDVLDTAARVTGRTIPVTRGPRRPGDPAVLIASGDRARELLQWAPQWSDLEALIETAWRWHRGRFG